MASTITQLINNNFGGIRRKNSGFSDELISCSDCQNVELFFTKLNSGIGIRTAAGNSAITTTTTGGVTSSCIPTDEQVIEVFSSNQDGTEKIFVYTETTNETPNQGKLYTYTSLTNTLTQFDLTAALGSGGKLTATGKACGCDFTQGILDMFVFSNGAEVIYIYSNTETHTAPAVESSSNIHLVDENGDDVFGLGLYVFDSRLWIFNGKTLWYSQQAECRNFTPGQQVTLTSPGYIEFVKNITAIHPYLGSLAVFHSNSSSLVTVDTSSTDMPKFIASDESPGGCASYRSLVFHGTDLYFYDDTKKGVFSFKQIVNGDKTLGDNIAVDLQEELVKIKQQDLHLIKALSVVTEDRNEVWMMVPVNVDDIEDDVVKERTLILIFDYIRGEWVKRKCQKINTIVIFENDLFSAGKEIYSEYTGETFDGEYIQHFYNCSIFNYGQDNTLKITKFPPRLTVDGNYKCHFWVKYIKNYQALKTPKVKEIQSRQIPNVLVYDMGMNWDEEYLYEPNALNTIVKIPSATFKALEICFYTTAKEQQFAIKTIEFSKLKVKQV